MKIGASSIRPNTLLDYQKRLWRVIKVDHVKTGRGGAFAQVEMKDIETGTKLNERFRAEDKVDEVELETRKMHYSYEDGDALVFLDNESYEPLSVAREFLENEMGYLLPNTEIQAKLYDNRLISVELPSNVILEIIEADPVVKGQSATSSYKPATLETGLNILVPQFIGVGDRIKINTGTGEYVERA
ncbi:MAG TPA: elongation factor P [Gammaproteobacteria bacterium]|nr:elongation factor P [Gammaproteobacteria bacterium]